MSINPMQNIRKAHAAPRCRAKSKRTGQRCRALACEVFACAECMALVGELQKESETGIIGTAPDPRKTWCFGNLSKR